MWKGPARRVWEKLANRIWRNKNKIIIEKLKAENQRLRVRVETLETLVDYTSHDPY